MKLTSADVSLTLFSLALLAYLFAPLGEEGRENNTNVFKEMCKTGETALKLANQLAPFYDLNISKIDNAYFTFTATFKDSFNIND